MILTPHSMKHYHIGYHLTNINLLMTKQPGQIREITDMTVIRISTKILLIGIFLTLTACFNNPTTPTASILTPTSIPTDKPTPTAEPSATPTPTEEPPAVDRAPLQPLLTWTLAPDGAPYVLDASHRLYQLDPQNLAPLARSEPLIPTIGSRPTPSDLYDRARYLLDFTTLAVGETRLFVSGGAFTQTLILDRETFAPITTLDKTGYIALDPGRHLFLMADEVTPEGLEWRALWVYDLTHLDQEPESLFSPPTYPSTGGGGTVNLIVDPEARLLYRYGKYYSGSSSRGSANVNIYNIDTLAHMGCIHGDSDGFSLSRPAIAPESDLIFATAYYSAPGASPRLLVFDRQGEVVDWGVALSGDPTVDARGEWIYLQKEHGLWVVRRGDDFSLQSVLPFTTPPPADVLLSPDDQTLYLLGNGWLTAMPTEELQTLGIPPVGPGFPNAWGDLFDPTVWNHPVWYGPTGLNDDGVQFAVTGSEVYRSTDTGRSWQFLPAFTYLHDLPVESISISPDYADDRTLVVRTESAEYLYRSTDGGETLEEWTPRIAFTSDRDNNREIYTMDPEGKDVQRVTHNPASDEAPAWSPGWSRLVFQSDRSGNWDIYSIRTDCPSAAEADCDLRRLTNDPADDMLPAWSPDGRYIAFVSTREGTPDIYVMQNDGQNQTRLTLNEAGDWRPAWLPNSEYLIFTSDRSGNNDLYRLQIPAFSNMPYTSEFYTTQFTTDPGDDRDAAVGLGSLPMNTKILSLSDRDGLMKTYSSFFKSQTEPSLSAYSIKTEQAEAHPSWDAFNRLALVAREEDGRSTIYKGWYSDYVPLTDGKNFDGQPAGGPVWWRPDIKFDW
jgi:hypothetical protein